MVKYSSMRRITQILASILFTITVLTVYIAFDFILNGTDSKRSALEKTMVNRLSEHKQARSHLSHEIKLKRQKSIESSSAYNSSTKSNADHIQYPDKKDIHHSKLKQFPKGKTGIKLNKPRKVMKDRSQRLSTKTTTSSHSHNDKNKHLNKRND